MDILGLMAVLSFGLTCSPSWQVSDGVPCLPDNFLRGKKRVCRWYSFPDPKTTVHTLLPRFWEITQMQRCVPTIQHKQAAKPAFLVLYTCCPTLCYTERSLFHETKNEQPFYCNVAFSTEGKRIRGGAVCECRRGTLLSRKNWKPQRMNMSGCMATAGKCTEGRRCRTH